MDTIQTSVICTLSLDEDRTSALLEDLELSARGEPVEVIVRMEDWNTFSHARCCDQTVERLANRDSGPSGLPVQPCGETEVVQRLQSEDGEGSQSPLNPSRLSLRSEALQDLGEDNVGEGHWSPALKQFDAPGRLTSLYLVDDIYPDARIDNDQERPKRLVFRSPSQRTLPRILRISSLRYRATNSRSARSTASRL